MYNYSIDLYFGQHFQAETLLEHNVPVQIIVIVIFLVRAKKRRGLSVLHLSSIHGLLEQMLRVAEDGVFLVQETSSVQ